MTEQEKYIKKVMQLYYEKGLDAAMIFLNDITKIEFRSTYNGIGEPERVYKRKKKV